MSSPSPRTRSEVEQYYGHQSLPKRIYNRISSSFLLLFTLFGFLIFLIGAVLSFGLNEQIWGPVLGASGAVIALINVTMYLGYRFIASRY